MILVYTSKYGIYFEVNLTGSKAANQKQEFEGFEPQTFQLWVNCLAVWAITQSLGDWIH